MASQDKAPPGTTDSATNETEESQRSEHQPGILLVNTPETVKTLVDALSSLSAPTNTVCVDLEGVKLSRHGSISLIQIWAPTLDQAFIVGVHTLGPQAFDTGNAK